MADDDSNRPSNVKLKLKLHFQHMSEMGADKPLVFQVQKIRLDFIQYCLTNSKKLPPNNVALDEYLSQPKESSSDSLLSTEILSPADMNRKKLSILFAHLSAFHYDLEGLTIEPVAPADLMEKIRDINEMTDDDVSEYLQKLIGEKIPGYAQMPVQDFLMGIQNCYKEEGARFHCYLRENFSNPLRAAEINEAKPTLNYFMPNVFCQQHLNTCDIVTNLSILKKIVKNFDQLQDVCFSTKPEFPREVIEARQKIAVLEKKFEAYLQNPASASPLDVKKIAHNYVDQVKVIQIQMEKRVGEIIEPSQELFLKKENNHTLATLKHLITTRIIPEGFNITNKIVENLTHPRFTPFQQKVLENHLFMEIEKKDVVRGLHNDKSAPEVKVSFLESIKNLFLFGKSRANVDILVVSHALVMDIDGSGNLKIIEHKNGKPQTTLLSHEGLKDIGIFSSQQKNSTAVKTTLDSITQSLSELYIERENILKFKKVIKEDTPAYKELESAFEKNKAEINDLLTIVHDIKVKNGVVNPFEENDIEDNVADGSRRRCYKAALRAIKAEGVEEEGMAYSPIAIP